MSEIDVLSSLSKVPPFPPIAARLLTLLSDESVSIPELAELIGSDPTLSARLLQCVNSLEFSLASPVYNVGQALTILGMDRTRQTIVTVATAVYTKGALHTKELRLCWEHTLATAILADQIAHECKVSTTVAYTAGIIHDIGRLGLLVAYPKDYERIIRDASAQCLDLLDFERDQFGIDHAAAGRILAEQWKLPEEFLVIAGRHHDPCEGSELDLLRIVHVACRLADALGYHITRPLVTLEVDQILEELPKEARARLTTPPEEWRAQIQKRIQAFEGHKDIAEEAEALVAETAEPVEPEAFPESELHPATHVRLFTAIAAIAAIVILAVLLLRH